MTGSKYFEVRLVLLGRWWRLFFGFTFKPKIFRNVRFYGHRLWAVRLWHLDLGWWRIVSLQTRVAKPHDKRFVIWQSDDD